MKSMFSGKHEIGMNFNQPLNNWNVSNVTDMEKMFLGCHSFNQPLDKWDVSKVTTMNGMFSGAKSFNQPLNNWDVSAVIDMKGMFGGTPFNQPLNNWDVSSVTNMESMFYSAVNFNQPLDNWNISSLTNTKDMFKGASSFEQKFAKNNSEPKDFLVKKTQIKINDQFSLNNPDNKFKLIDYTWNGGDDFNYNIFNKDPLPEGEYIGSPSSSELTISVNDTTLYIKHYNIQDGPIPEDFYLEVD